MEKFYFRDYETPIGRLFAISQESALIRLGVCPEGIAHKDTAPVFWELQEWLNTYFTSRDPGPTPPLAPEGSPFQLRVWEELQKIPFGSVTTYGTIAKAIHQKTFARAVGQAIGKNPLLILIPCHRVIAADQKIGGYSAGIERKLQLLNVEGQPQNGWNYAVYRS